MARLDVVGWLCEKKAERQLARAVDRARADLTRNIGDGPDFVPAPPVNFPAITGNVEDVDPFRQVKALLATLGPDLPLFREPLHGPYGMGRAYIVLGPVDTLRAQELLDKVFQLLHANVRKEQAWRVEGVLSPMSTGVKIGITGVSDRTLVGYEEAKRPPSDLEARTAKKRNEQ
jgi:hypothetical protein